MIHAQTLVKAFGDVRAVDGVSFRVSPGEIFAFLGRTAPVRRRRSGW
jgi:ABC-type multidrug transport system ATPase subunit